LVTFQQESNSRGVWGERSVPPDSLRLKTPPKAIKKQKTCIPSPNYSLWDEQKLRSEEISTIFRRSGANLRSCSPSEVTPSVALQKNKEGTLGRDGKKVYRAQLSAAAWLTPKKRSYARFFLIFPQPV